MSITNWATQAFGTETSEVWSLTPRSKFLFTVYMSVGPGAPIEFTRVSNVQVPDYSYDTQVVNQYNRKRVIQNKINYGTLQIQFYDTHDNAFANILSSYNKNYFNSGLGTDAPDTGAADSAIQPQFTTPYGFNPNSTKYFIPEIMVIQHGLNTTERVFTCKNCFITNAQLELLDYSDSNPSMWSTTFQPEGVFFGHAIKKDDN